jgi:multiple sugar transport system ATP-binding protein
VPSEAGKRVSPAAGRRVVFGIRPEDIYDRLFRNAPAKNENAVKATVDVVEPMGSELYVYLKAGRTDVVARMPPQVKVQAGQEIEVVFDLERLHLFDEETGRSLL